MKIKKGLSLIVLLVLFVGCLSVSQAESATKKVTLMVYMCGSNLESENGLATRTISEIRHTRYNADEVNVVFLIGGSTYWMSGYDPKSLTLIQANGASRVTPLDEIEWNSMGDPETLSMFLGFCYENYPAESYDLVLWDHGGGPNSGVCFDEVYERKNGHYDSLKIPELTSALEESPFSNKGLDLIIFHACLMSSAEVANSLSPYAKYMIASEDSQYGLDYTWLKDIEKDETPLETAKKIVDYSFSNNEEIVTQRHEPEINVFSVIDLDKVPALIQPLNEFFAKVNVETTDVNFTAMSKMRRDTVTFGNPKKDGETDYDLIDLSDLVNQYQQYAPEEAEKLQAAIEDAIPYVRTANDQCAGLTVYHPYKNKNAAERYVSAYEELHFSDEYSSYIREFSKLLLGNPMADYSQLNTEKAESDKDNRVLFILGLDETQAEHYIESKLEVLQKREDGSYIFTYMNPETTFADARITGEFTGTALYVVDKEGNRLAGPLKYDINGDIYYLEALLHRNAGSVYDEEGELEYGWSESDSLALITCAYDPTSKELLPGGVKIYDEETGGYTTAHNTMFSDYDSIQIATTAYTEKRNENNALLDFEQWDAVGEPEVWSGSINSDWHFELVNDTLDTGSLYAVFQITDSQNNMYSSEPLCAKEELPADPIPTYDDLGFVTIGKFTANVHDNTISITMELKNIQEQEVVLSLENLMINGIQMELNEGTGEAYGNGPDEGLVQDEIQVLTAVASLDPVKEQTSLTSITFDICAYDASTDQLLQTVPVNVAWNYSLEEKL